jgi:hypothetical protein
VITRQQQTSSLGLEAHGPLNSARWLPKIDPGNPEVMLSVGAEIHF